MIAAFSTSSLFLVCYLVYHAQVGSVRFTRQGPIRIVYFTILLTHTVLAAAIVPLVLMTLVARPQARRMRGITGSPAGRCRSGCTSRSPASSSI